MQTNAHRKIIKPVNNLRLFVIISISVLVILNIIALIVGNHFYLIAINKNKPDNLKDYYTEETSLNHYNVERDSKLNKEEIIVNSQYGYDLKGTYFKNSTATQNTVILVHGIGDNRWSMMKYADIYLDNGYNVLIYDTRNHGESGGNKISYGYFEQDDLEKVVQYVKARNPEAKIGIHGLSMGAATVMLHSEKYTTENSVAFYVEDCGYSDLSKLFATRLKEDYHIPNILIVEYASFFSSIRADFSFKSVSPLKNMDKVKAPMLFIHGDSDTFVPYSMVNELFNSKPGIKQLYVAKDAKHAKSFDVDKKKYQQVVADFLKLIP